MSPEHALARTTQLEYTSQPTYDSLIRSFNREISEPITFDLIYQYFDSMKANGYRSATLHCAKAAIKQGILHTFPQQANDVRFRSSLDVAFRSIRCGKPERAVHREMILSQDDIAELIDAMPEKLAIIFETLSVSALRISELTGIRLSDIRTENGKVFVTITGKGFRQRRIFLSWELFQHIRTVFNGQVFLFENGNGHRYCRKYLWREVNRFGKKILGRSVFNHQFRHSWASYQLIQRQKSLKAIAAYLGNSVQTTTTYYIHDQLAFEDIFPEAKKC